MIRRVRTAVAASAVAVVVAGGISAATPAQAASTGTSYAAAVKIGSGRLTPSIQATGLLAFLQPILNAVINPLLQAVAALPTVIIDDITNVLLGGYRANTPISSVSIPSGSFISSPAGTSFPSCSSTGFAQGNCYGGSIGVSGPISFSINGPRGFATADANLYGASSQSYGSSLSLFGFNLVSNSGPTSGVTCPVAGTSGTPANTWSMASTSMLGGLLGTSLASKPLSGNGTLLSANLGSTSVGVTSVGGTLIDLPGVGFTARMNSNLLYINVNLSVGALLGGLSVGTSFFSNAGTSPVTAAISLTLEIGPGGTLTSTSAESWGLRIGADLGFAFGFNILGTGLMFSAPSGITSTSDNPDLLDLKYAYANCTTGAAVPAASTTPSPTPSAGATTSPSSGTTAVPTATSTPAPATSTAWVPPGLN